MSMYFTANKIFGLLLTDDEIYTFQREYCRHNQKYLKKEFKNELKNIDPNDEELLLIELTELTADRFIWSEDMFVDQETRNKELHTYIINSDHAEGMTFAPISMVNDINVTQKDIDEGMIIPAKMGYSEISALSNMPFYKSTDEVINEFKELVGELLPDDFDYMNHIGEFWYAFCA